MSKDMEGVILLLCFCERILYTSFEEVNDCFIYQVLEIRSTTVAVSLSDA